MGTKSTAAANLRAAFDLFAAGSRMMRQSLRRRHPGLDEAAIDVLYREWLHERPGAEQGDGAGRPVTWPRPNRSAG